MIPKYLEHWARNSIKDGIPNWPDPRLDELSALNILGHITSFVFNLDMINVFLFSCLLTLLTLKPCISHQNALSSKAKQRTPSQRPQRLRD
jgi:hypothetical protein